jgi:hypothetical protein
MPPESNPPPAADKAAYDEFSAAFADATANDTAPAPTTPVPAATTPAPAAAAEPPPEPTTPAAAAPAGDGGTPVAEPASEPVTPAATTPEPDAAARLAEIEAEYAEYKKAHPDAPATPAPAPAAPAAAEPAPAPAAPVTPQWYQFTSEEQQILDAYDKDWKDNATAEGIRRKADIYNAVSYVFAEMRNKFEPTLKHFQEVSDAITDQLTLMTLRGQHSDYDSVVEKVGDWVETLPVPFRNGAKQVMESGTPEEVAALVAEYKKANPTAPAVVASGSPTPAATPRTGKQGSASLTPQAIQAAQKLSVVGTKRGSTANAVDPNDFDGAWAEAMRAENAK